MFVGEAPGAEEDRQGLPFVGRAGQLLNQMLEGIGLSREDVFIANVLKSRPPGNRDPQPLEIEACRPYLFEQVRLIEPRVVCTLGNFATKLLSGNPAGITRVRGTPQVHELGGRTVFLLPLFHPAAALRTPAVKETLRGRLRDAAGAARRSPLPGAAPSASEEIEEAEGAAAAAAARRPARLLWLSRERIDDAARAARDRSARRAARRRPRARRPGARRRRGRRRQDDADPRRLPGARGRGAGHLADLHDRPALPGRRAAGSPTSTSTGSPASRARTRRCSTTISTPDAIAFVEWPAAGAGRLGRAGARGAAQPRRRRRREIELIAASTPQIGVFTRERRCSIGRRKSDVKEEVPQMKGLKTLTATLSVAALLASLAPASASAAAYSHYVACGVSAERETRARLPESAQKGRLLQKQQRDGLLHGLRQVPERQTPLRADSEEAVQGTLYVNKITSNIPGKHRVSWFVEGKKVGTFVFTVPG